MSYQRVTRAIRIAACSLVIGTGCAETTIIPRDLPSEASFDASLDTRSDADATLDASDADSCTGASCQSCTRDQECREKSIAQPFCVAGHCLECKSDNDCVGLTPFCSAAGACVGCKDSNDCYPNAPACRESVCRSCGEVECSVQEARAESWFDLACIPSIRENVQGTQMDQERAACAPQSIGFLLDVLGVDSIDETRVTYNRTDLRSCFASYPNDLRVDGCFVTQGIRADGETCNNDLECISGECSSDMRTCPGTCISHSGENEACSSGIRCDEGLSCISNLCKPMPTLGQTCANECVFGLVCGPSRVCINPLTNGASCTRTEQCGPGLFCRGTPLQCRVNPGIREACDAYGMPCADGLYCDSSTRECKQGILEGQSCVSSTCAEGLRCVNAICKRIKLPGETCTITSECVLGTRCERGRCAHMPVLGEACTPQRTADPLDRPCFVGVCTGGICSERNVGDTCEGDRSAYDCGVSMRCLSETNRCVALIPEGGSCGARGQECELDLFCSNNVCTRSCAQDSFRLRP